MHGHCANSGSTYICSVGSDCAEYITTSNNTMTNTPAITIANELICFRFSNNEYSLI